MRPDQRRRLDRVSLVVGAALVGVAAMAGAFIGDTERIGAYWTSAHLASDDTATITEVIDYDFGSTRRHGILRQIPDVTPDNDFMVSSPTAPDEVQVLSWWAGTELRVGDPLRTISNRHRYAITYPHTGLVFGPIVSWNAVGDGWDITVHDVEVHLTSDRELVDPACDTGRLGETGGCSVQVIGPGHIVVEHEKVRPGEFLTVTASLGGPATVDVATPPRGSAPDPGAGWLTPTWIAFVAALLGAGAISLLCRRLGQEWVWDGGHVDAAFGPSVEIDAPVRRVDHAELADMTTIEFEAPRDLSAALGGVVQLERVTDDHKTAWLLECAIREEIEIDPGDGTPSIRRGAAQPNPAVSGVLDKMFGADTTMDLSSYNPTFAAGWGELGTALEEWRRNAGMWDERGRHRQVTALIAGGLGFVVAAAATGLAAAFANRYGPGWLPVMAVVAALAGVGIGALIRAWELRIRTPKGSGAWIRVESFRRFLHDSEAAHVERAAEMGLLRQYTAWAAALGEVDRWEKAVDAAVAEPGSNANLLAGHAGFVHVAPMLSRATAAASTAPSSSGGGGGGGGGGGSGGGGGGGGGGSW